MTDLKYLDYAVSVLCSQQTSDVTGPQEKLRAVLESWDVRKLGEREALLCLCEILLEFKYSINADPHHFFEIVRNSFFEVADIDIGRDDFNRGNVDLIRNLLKSGWPINEIAAIMGGPEAYPT